MIRLFVFSITLTFGQALGQKVEPLLLPKDTPWNVAVLKRAPQFEWLRQEGKVHALKYAGEKYRGKSTRVFAYYASPKTLGQSADINAPGIVLVHGGGGTAFANWAMLWAKRGYAAIAMDLAGCGEGRKRLSDGGPEQGHTEKFSAIDEPLENQWTYHAVANVVRGHSLLRSLDGVDADRTALTGISWGGYLTCIVAGLDDRFKVAMPVYGCGFLRENSVWKASEFGKMTTMQSDKWHRLWDPSRYIGYAKMPLMFLNGTNDFAYPMDSYAKTCALVRSKKNYSIQLNMKHGHIFDFPEFFLFVDQYILNGTPMPVVARPVIKKNKVSALVKADTTLIEAKLYYTTATHDQNRSRKWQTVDLALDGNRIHGDAPPNDAKVWYVAVRDERKAIASSELIVP
jgi:dienelactone hydrolase